MLAQAARQSGLIPLVMDLYADRDTQTLAHAHWHLKTLGLTALKPALDDCLKQFSVAGVVYGSGLETQLDCLNYLTEHLPLWGNSPSCLKRLNNKRHFFQQLQSADIPFPCTQFAPPTHRDHWLCKPQHGCGGQNINYLQDSSPNHNVYWQRYHPGTPASVLFLTNGQDALILGFNSQWCQPSASQPFLFSGIMNSLDLPTEQRQLVTQWVTQLTVAFNLHGLNSLDFIWDGQACLVLEINPRPPASMQLYAPTLLKLHIEACQGLLPQQVPQVKQNQAYQIIYAPTDLKIPSEFIWPAACVDLPQNSAKISAGQPICSMIAHAESPAGIHADLHALQHKILLQVQQVQNIMEFASSVNTLTQPLVSDLITNAAKYRVAVQKLTNGSTVIDAGINVPGGLEAGRIIAEICMGGLGTVTLTHSPYTTHWPLSVNVHSSNPVLACLGSQYAGWSLSHEKYYALGSGPARALASKIKENQREPVEELYKELGYQDHADAAVLVIENDAIPPIEIVEKIATACQIDPSKLTIIVTPTSSLAGGVQVVARVLEVAMHKAHALHFPLENIIDGSGSAPVCPPHPNFVKAMGRTNDAILFAGQVHIFVKGNDADAEKLALALPSSTSSDYGKPFAEIFKAYNYDFFKVDAMLFSPASVIVTAVESGKSFRAGQLDNALLDQSFGV